MPTYKLYYFNGKGRAETTRLAFAASGIKYEDVRINKEDWPNYKTKTFSGQMPYLEVDGKTIIESMAIARFVAREGGLMGKTSFEAATIDSVVDVISSMLEKAVVVKFTPEGPQKDAAKKEFAEKHFAVAALLLEKFLGDKKCLVTNEISLADLHFFSIFEFIADLPWQESHPKLKALHDSIAAHPLIAEYLKTRPKTEF